MAESSKAKLRKLREAGLAIPDDLPDKDVQRLSSLTDEEIKALARIFDKVSSPKEGPHFRVHPGPLGGVQKKGG